MKIAQHTKKVGLIIFMAFCLQFWLPLFSYAEEDYLEENALINIDDSENLLIEDTNEADYVEIKPELQESFSNTSEPQDYEEINPPDKVDEAAKAEKLETIKKAIEEYRQTIINHFLKEEKSAKQRVGELQEYMEAGYSEYEAKGEKIKKLEEKIPEIKKDILTLEEQTELIDNQLALSHLKIEVTEKQIERKKKEIFNIMKLIQKTSIELVGQKRMLIDYIGLLNWEWKNYRSLSGGNISTLKILLSDVSLSTYFQRKVYLEAIHKKGKQILYRLNNTKQFLLDQEEAIGGKKELLSRLHTRLRRERNYLRMQQINRADLLAKTQGTQQRYQQLLEQYKKEQEEVMLQISALGSNITEIQEKLKELDRVSKKETDIKVNQKLLELYENYQLETVFEKGNNVFSIWPVEPMEGISAYFRDPTYPFGVHNGLDIPIPHGSHFYAPAPAYVYKVIDNGMDYSYIILAHRDNILTVYGHISKFLVKEGDLVQAGDLLGRTGGTPGSKGSGWMTTGPHLHFEVLKNNKHLDPLGYLQLEGHLADEYIPVKFKK